MCQCWHGVVCILIHEYAVLAEIYILHPRVHGQRSSAMLILHSRTLSALSGAPALHRLIRRDDHRLRHPTLSPNPPAHHPPAIPFLLRTNVGDATLLSYSSFASSSPGGLSQLTLTPSLPIAAPHATCHPALSYSSLKATLPNNIEMLFCCASARYNTSSHAPLR